MKRIKTRETSVQSSTEMNLIRIPFFQMSSNVSKPKLDEEPVSFVNSSYKLVDGLPKCSEIRIRKSYVVSYNKETKNADWVYEILNKDTVKNNFKKQRSFGSNEMEGDDCDQGHLAAAANHRWCQEAYHDTFLLSNMVPQNKMLNRGPWKTLENYCRNKAMDDEVCNVHVYSGPLYLEEKKTWKGGKAVPTHFFKVIILEKKDGTVVEPECYVMPKTHKEDTDIQTEANIDNLEVVKNHYIWDIRKFEESVKLGLIEEHPSGKMMDCIKMTTWTGEGTDSAVYPAIFISPFSSLKRKCPIKLNHEFEFRNHALKKHYNMIYSSDIEQSLAHLVCFVTDGCTFEIGKCAPSRREADGYFLYPIQNTPPERTATATHCHFNQYHF